MSNLLETEFLVISTDIFACAAFELKLGTDRSGVTADAGPEASFATIISYIIGRFASDALAHTVGDAAGNCDVM